MTPRSKDPVADTLREILVSAGDIALKRFGAVRAVAKPDGTQVTAADREVEDFLVAALLRAFPGDGVISEEGTRVPSEGSTWHCDPIDGTSAYVEGLAHWGPTVIRVTDGKLDFGAFYMPLLKSFFFAKRGGGAWRDDVRLAPGDPGGPGRHHSLYAPSRFHRVGPVPWPGKVRALGSSAAHLCMVAAGGGLVTVVPKWHLWDIGLGVLLVEEAGRRVCDVRGNPVDVIACQPGLPILAGASSALDLLVDSGWTTDVLR